MSVVPEATGGGPPAEARPCPVKPDRHPGFVRLGERFERALDYAVEAHREQARKSSPVPYLAHLLGVTSLVLEYGGDEDQAIAGLLHDTLEDCGAEHGPAIEARFGAGVLGLVRACTDWEGPAEGGGKPPWRPRKEAYIAHLDELGRGHPALLVSCADKLHNARAIRADLRHQARRSGDANWPKRATGRHQNSPSLAEGTAVGLAAVGPGVGSGHG